MIEFPLYLQYLQGGVIIDVVPYELKVKLPDGRIAIVKINDDEFEATYLGDFE